MIKSIQLLEAAKVPYTDTNLKSIQNLLKRYQFYGQNVAEEQIVNYIIKNYDAKKDNMKAIFSALHNMKFAPIKKGQKVSRNANCPCGSTQKYKKCCLTK